MQHIYQDLVSGPHADQSESGGEFEEAGAGLDLFRFRNIFFGTPVASQTPGKRPSSSTDGSSMFLPYDVAKIFLKRYLSSLYHMMRFRPPEVLEWQLEQLYDPKVNIHAQSSVGRLLVLMGLACGAQGTEYHEWGDILFGQAKAAYAPLDDVVNVQTVQLSLLMISFSS